MESVFNDILAKPLYTLAADEIDTIKVNSISFPDGISGNLWGKVIMRAVKEVEHIEGKKEALKLIDKAYDELDRVYPQLFDEKSELLKTSCLFFIQENDQREAHKKMERYLYNAIAQVHFQAINEKMPYYSFRGFSKHSLEDIENETISLAHPREFNDPLDTILVYWLNEEVKKKHADEWQLRYRLLMKKVSEHIKIRCLIAGQNELGNEKPIEDINVLMWSHYADSHKGFCVKYVFDRDMFDLTKHSKRDKLLLVDKIKYSETIDISDEPSIRMALLEKSDFWKYENEMRLISYDCSGEDKEFPVVECKGMAKAVYLGVKCSDENRRLMEKAIGDKNIPLYQMSVDEEKLTRFKKTLIG